jgi:hypothetical protein
VWRECVARGRDAEKLLSGLRQWSRMDSGPAAGETTDGGGKD